MRRDEGRIAFCFARSLVGCEVREAEDRRLDAGRCHRDGRESVETGDYVGGVMAVGGLDGRKYKAP